MVPLRFFVAKLGQRYFVFMRTAQGSRGAPLSFAVLVALASRFIQSLLLGPARRGQPEGRLQVYVDDPLAILVGSEARANRLASIVATGWLLLRFPLAFHKAVISNVVTWIGVKITVEPDAVHAEVPEAKGCELITPIEEAMESNVIC